MYTLPLLHYVCVIHYFGKGKSEHRKNIPNFISKVKKSVIFEFSEHFSQNIASKHGQSKDMTEHAHYALILHLSKVLEHVDLILLISSVRLVLLLAENRQ